MNIVTENPWCAGEVSLDDKILSRFPSQSEGIGHLFNFLGRDFQFSGKNPAEIGVVHLHPSRHMPQRMAALLHKIG
jgi:hypothetical protein